MSCRLSQERVFELADKHGVPLKEGLCQNKFRMPDGSIGICECPIGEHPISQGKNSPLLKDLTKYLFYPFSLNSWTYRNLCFIFIATAGKIFNLIPISIHLFKSFNVLIIFIARFLDLNKLYNLCLSCPRSVTQSYFASC